MPPAVYTQCILPHPVLQPYVRCFAIRKFDTNGHEFYKPIFAEHEMIMTFFIRTKLFGFDSTNKEKPAFHVADYNVLKCVLEPVQTFTKGFAVFKGLSLLISIHFKPVGFFYIFNIPSGELLNELHVTNDIVSNDINGLEEQLQDVYSMTDSIKLIELFLLKKLTSYKPLYKNEGIIKASWFLSQNETYCIKKLASDCNMSLQTFEVCFTEQIGIAPKHYMRIKRFNSAVTMKLYNPGKSWTDIAYSCGYYDQAHLIKDFKGFTLLAPRNFMITIHPVFEDFE